MSPEEIRQWADLERRANAFETGHDVLAAAGIPLVTITTEDRLRGAIVEAVYLIEIGQAGRAYPVLKEALKL